MNEKLDSLIIAVEVFERDASTEESRALEHRRDELLRQNAECNRSDDVKTLAVLTRIGNRINAAHLAAVMAADKH
jgi:hypothetical protein